MPDSATPIDERMTAVPEQLWTIDELAAFLRRCENTARKIAALADAPKPVFADGKGALWDPRAWWAWADARQQVAAAACPDDRGPRQARRSAGRSTRV